MVRDVSLVVARAECPGWFEQHHRCAVRRHRTVLGSARNNEDVVSIEVHDGLPTGPRTVSDEVCEQDTSAQVTELISALHIGRPTSR